MMERVMWTLVGFRSVIITGHVLYWKINSNVFAISFMWANNVNNVNRDIVRIHKEFALRIFVGTKILIALITEGALILTPNLNVFATTVTPEPSVSSVMKVSSWTIKCVTHRTAPTMA